MTNVDESVKVNTENMAEAAHQQGEKKSEKEVKDVPETKGWLYKWTNYIKGYQKRWFVLQNGLLSYYRFI